MRSGGDLSGQHAVITGGGTGIGAAIADRLNDLGAHITLMGRRRSKLEAKIGSLVNASAVEVDVTNEKSVKKAFAEAGLEHGPISILVNNAGVAETAKLGDTTLKLWRRMLNVNLTGVFLCTRAYLSNVDESDYGRVINIASTAGLQGYAYVSAYCAAKHGVIGLTRALALETARTGITVNAVCPGYTNTKLVDNAIDNIVAKTGRSAAEARAEFVKANPQGRLVEPSEVAAMVGWLCLPGSDALTGQAIAVAGGEVM